MTAAITKILAESGKAPAPMASLLRDTTWLTFGLNGEDNFVFQLQAQGKDKAGAKAALGS